MWVKLFSLAASAFAPDIDCLCSSGIAPADGVSVTACPAKGIPSQRVVCHYGAMLCTVPSRGCGGRKLFLSVASLGISCICVQVIFCLSPWPGHKNSVSPDKLSKFTCYFFLLEYAASPIWVSGFTSCLLFAVVVNSLRCASMDCNGL